MREAHAAGSATRRDRIETAGVERRAFQEPQEGKREAGEGAMRANRVGGVVRARRGETATAGRKQNDERGGNGALVEPHESEERARGQAEGEAGERGDHGVAGGAALRQASRKRASSSGKGVSRAAARAESRLSVPVGRLSW